VRRRRRRSWEGRGGPKGRFPHLSLYLPSSSKQLGIDKGAELLYSFIRFIYYYYYYYYYCYHHHHNNNNNNCKGSRLRIVIGIPIESMMYGR